MRLKQQAGFMQHFLLGLSLKKLFIASSLISILLLTIVSILGVKQYLLYQHCEQVVTTSKHLLFQFSTIKENVNEALITQKKLQFKEINEEIEALETDISFIMNDILIPADFKQGFITQMDLVGLVVKLRTVQETAENTPTKEQLSALTALLRSIYGRVIQFHQSLSSYTEALLLGLHKTLVGFLALVIFVVSSLLFLVNHSLAGPILQLGQKVQGFIAEERNQTPPQGKEGQQDKQDRNLDVSVHEIVKSVTNLSSEHLRLSRILNAITFYDTLDKKEGFLSTKHLQDLCSVLQTNADYCLVWAGICEQEDELPKPVSACGCLAANEEGCLDVLDHLLRYCKKNGGLCDSVSMAMQTKCVVVSRLLISSLPESLHGLLPFTKDTFSSATFPVVSADKRDAFITLYHPGHDCFKPNEIALLSYFFKQTVWIPTTPDSAAPSVAPVGSLSLPLPQRTTLYRDHALGNLVAGLAHELTDLSNGSINYTQALLDLMEEQSQPLESTALLDKLMGEEKKISRLAVELQQFTSDSNEGIKHYTIQDVVKSIATLNKGQLKTDGIDLQIKIDSDLPAVPKYGQDVQLALLSLFQHASARVLAKYPVGRHEKKQIRINVTLAPTPARDQLHITLHDQGLAWSPMESGKTQSGTSSAPWLELHQDKLFLHSFGGDLTVETGSDDNNICTLILPR